MPVRSILWLGFFAAILAAWWVLYSMSTGMGLDLIGRPGPMAEAMRGMDPRMDMAMPMAEFGPLFGMWAVMMAAMMLPTMVPTLRAYEDLMHSAGATRAGWLGVVLGYLAVWTGFAAVITAVQLGLLFSGLVDMLGIATSPLVAGGLLIAVGAFQFTRAKELCHGVCHGPTLYFLGRWRPGFAGGLRMGLGLGAFCVGCCWGFMALGFVGGVMSLLWMGLATLFMVLEKLPQIGHRVTRPMGGALILGGGAVLAPALIAGG
jgi:predicted metal-binding membrane protein